MELTFVANKKRMFGSLEALTAPTLPKISRGFHVFPTLFRPSGLRCGPYSQKGAGAGFKTSGSVAQACGGDSGIAARSAGLAGDGLQRHMGDRWAHWRAAPGMSE